MKIEDDRTKVWGDKTGSREGVSLASMIGTIQLNYDIVLVDPLLIFQRVAILKTNITKI